MHTVTFSSSCLNRVTCTTKQSKPVQLPPAKEAAAGPDAHSILQGRNILPCMLVWSSSCGCRGRHDFHLFQCRTTAADSQWLSRNPQWQGRGHSTILLYVSSLLPQGIDSHLFEWFRPYSTQIFGGGRTCRTLVHRDIETSTSLCFLNFDTM